jgi:hypothetical protein
MATQQKNELHDVFDEIINSGSSATVAPPKPASKSAAAVATQSRPQPQPEPAHPLPGGKAVSTKLTAPGTAPVGPRHAGANACEAGRADKRHMATTNRRTSLRGSFLTQGVLTEVGVDDGEQLKIADLVMTGLRFLSPVPLRPGTVRQLKTTGGDDAKLSSAIRVVSTRVRPDGQFDVTAEFY